MLNLDSKWDIYLLFFDNVFIHINHEGKPTWQQKNDVLFCATILILMDLVHVFWHDAERTLVHGNPHKFSG